MLNCYSASFVVKLIMHKVRERERDRASWSRVGIYLPSGLKHTQRLQSVYVCGGCLLLWQLLWLTGGGWRLSAAEIKRLDLRAPRAPRINQRGAARTYEPVKPIDLGPWSSRAAWLRGTSTRRKVLDSLIKLNAYKCD